MPKSNKVKNSPARKQPYRATKTRPKTKMSASNSKNSKRGAESQLSTSWQAETNANSSDPIYFWRPHEAWGFLGQWYDSPLKDGDKTFTCCEQYMMYHKAMTFDDEKIAQKVLDTTDPREHKSLGKKVSGFTDHKWDEVKFDIVVNANMLKYGGEAVAHKDDTFVYPPNGQINGQDSWSLKELLLSTGERELVEASPRDKIWGVGFSPEKAGHVDRAKWGKNLLGKALMEVRRRLREEVNGAGVQDEEWADSMTWHEQRRLDPSYFGNPRQSAIGLEFVCDRRSGNENC